MSSYIPVQIPPTQFTSNYSTLKFQASPRYLSEALANKNTITQHYLPKPLPSQITENHYQTSSHVEFSSPEKSSLRRILLAKADEILKRAPQNKTYRNPLPYSPRQPQFERPFLTSRSNVSTEPIRYFKREEEETIKKSPVVPSYKKNITLTIPQPTDDPNSLTSPTLKTIEWIDQIITRSRRAHQSSDTFRAYSPSPSPDIYSMQFTTKSPRPNTHERLQTSTYSPLISDSILIQNYEREREEIPKSSYEGLYDSVGIKSPGSLRLSHLQHDKYTPQKKSRRNSSDKKKALMNQRFYEALRKSQEMQKIHQESSFEKYRQSPIAERKSPITERNIINLFASQSKNSSRNPSPSPDRGIIQRYTSTFSPSPDRGVAEKYTSTFSPSPDKGITQRYTSTFSPSQPQRTSVSFMNTDREVKFALEEIKPHQVDENYYDGTNYKGDKVGSFRHGQGEMLYPNGSKYKGEWKSDKRNGYGILTLSDGKEEYNGDWEDDVYHGSGILINNNVKYNLNFDIQNFDTLQNNWVRYEGEFVHGKKHGFGTLILTDSEKFVGNFVMNRLEGTGTYHKINGDILFGEWKDNKFVSSL